MGQTGQALQNEVMNGNFGGRRHGREAKNFQTLVVSVLRTWSRDGRSKADVSGYYDGSRRREESQSLNTRGQSRCPPSTPQSRLVRVITRRLRFQIRR